jgi:hypothetical protein
LGKKAARSYIGNASGSKFLIWLPSNTWDDTKAKWCNENSWLTEDRKALVELILDEPSIDTVYCCSSVGSISVHNKSLYYTGPATDDKIPVDGYINLNDTGQRLLEALSGRIGLLSQGVNAPSGVWTSSLVSTSKVGIARSIFELIEQFERVRMPEFRRVDSIQDLNQFRDDTGKSVVLKDPFGTWGTGVVGIGLTDCAIEAIRNKEEQVRSTRECDEFQLINTTEGSFVFDSRNCSVSYGIVETTLSGSINQNGNEFNVVSVPAEVHPMCTKSPIDFVTLAYAEPNEGFSAPSTMMRVSGKAGINGNTQFKYINDTSIKNAMEKPIKIPHPSRKNKTFEFDLRMHLENIAGRHVTTSEISSAFQSGAELGLAARNLRAFRTEQKLENGYALS